MFLKVDRREQTFLTTINFISEDEPIGFLYRCLGSSQELTAVAPH